MPLAVAVVLRDQVEVDLGTVGWPAGLALSIPGGGGFTGLRLAGLGGTGLLGLGGITTGAAGATGAASVTGGCFHGRFFLGSGAGGRGSGL